MVGVPGSGRGRRGLALTSAWLVAFAVATTVFAASAPAGSHPAGARLDPSEFAELATGIVLVRDFNCGGTASAEGTGFLIGSRVVMTAAHVLRGACRAKVQTSDGKWIPVDRGTRWFASGKNNAAAVDVATLRLHTDVSGHQFTIRTTSAAVGARVAMLGHPLGEQQLSVTQGHVVAKGHVRSLPGVPMLALRLLGAEGGSGSPVVDDKGRVVGIFQLGLGAEDVLGQRTSGVLLGIDLPSWWPKAKRDLCRAYPLGGIESCSTSTAEPRPAPAPPPPPAPPPSPPAPPVWAPPSGFSFWRGAGSYAAGTIGAQTAPCSRTYATSATCWGVNVISELGCRDGAFVRVEIHDSYGSIVDYGINEIPFLAPGQIGLAHGDTFQSTATTFLITQIDCFNF